MVVNVQAVLFNSFRVERLLLLGLLTFDPYGVAWGSVTLPELASL